jgi:aldose 1-epimerase
VTYAVLSDENSLRIDYSATTDALTICNLTNHMYFNLNPLPTPASFPSPLSTISNHLLTLNAARYLPVDAHLIPTAELRDVSGGVFDFTSPRALSILWEVEVFLEYFIHHAMNWSKVTLQC